MGKDERNYPSGAFDPARAQQVTLETLQRAAATIVLNADALVPHVLEHLGAPSEDQAKAAIAMTIKVLVLLEHMIEEAPLSDMVDAKDLAQARRKGVH